MKIKERRVECRAEQRVESGEQRGRAEEKARRKRGVKKTRREGSNEVAVGWKRKRKKKEKENMLRIMTKYSLIFFDSSVRVKVGLGDDVSVC